MANTRAKFKCVEVTQMEYGNKAKFLVVTNDNLENASFFKMTPYGSIEMGTLNPNIVFIPGREYFIDFTLSE